MVRIFLIQTCEIKDTLKYYPNEIASSQNLAVNLPTNFKASFKIKCNNIIGSPSNAIWIECGSNSSNFILFGNVGSNGGLGVYVKINGSYADAVADNVLPAQTWIELTYTYENGVHTITDGTHTLTMNNSQITARNYLYVRSTLNPLKELYFMPL